MVDKDIHSNKKILIYSLVFTLILFFLQSENLGDRDNYSGIIGNIDDILKSNNNSLRNSANYFTYITGENLFYYLIFTLKSLNLNPSQILEFLSYITGFFTSYFVFRNSKNNLAIALIYLINIFTLTSSLVHIRSGLAMCLVFMTYDFPKLNKSLISRLIRFLAAGIHMGTIVYLFIDYFHIAIIKINKLFGRSAIIIFALATIISSNLLFLLLVKYNFVGSVRGSFIGFSFYLFLLFLFIFTNEKERNDNYISIIILTTYVSFYYIYPPVSRILQMGYPFIIISIININTSSRKLLTILFLAGNISALILNFKLLYV